MATTPAPGRRDRGGRSPADPSAGRSRWRRWAWWLALPGLFLALVLGAFLLVWLVQVPLPEDIAPGATTVLDRDGEVVGTLTGEATRRDVAFEEIPEPTRLAVLAAEDRGFYTHGGVSPLGILRAAVTNLRAGEVEEGGSTITQQYVKNAVVGNERTYLRKMKEAALAIKVDRQYSKDTVLGWYLNTIYWGRGAYGIGAAAQTYFDTTPTDLSLNQSATLAGMISSPENLDPLENPEAAEQRRVYVLDGMLEQGWITQAEHDEVVAAGLPEVSRNSALATQTAPYYMDAVRRELTGLLGDQAVAANLRVYTGLDLRMQRAAEQQVRDTVTDNELGVPELSGALVSVDPQNGEVRALVGGPDFQEQPFNIAVRGERQVGSTFKALTLGAWLEAGRSPEAVLPAPATIPVPGDEGGTISNYGGQGYGQASVYAATAASINTVYVQMQQELAAEPIIDLGVRLGLPEDRFSPFPSMTLGVDNFSPLAMAEAFATFAAEGIHVPAHTILRVEDAEGNVVYEADAAGEAVMEANDARAVTLGLRGVIEGGTGTAAAIGRPAAGKTGTTQDGKDGWFVGYTPDLVTAAWLGRPDNEAVDGLTGGGLPAAMWGRYMTAALEGVEASDFTNPDLSEYGVAPEPTTDPNACPEGYSEGVPAEDADVPPDGGPEGTGPVETRTEVAPGTEDREGGPCVRVVVVEPSPTPTETDTETETETESPSPTETDTATETEVPVPTETETTESPSPTAEPSPTASPGETQTEGTSRGASGGGGSDGGGSGGGDSDTGSSPSPSPTTTGTTSTEAIATAA